MKQAPLRVCKAVAACKCQGGAVGPGQAREKLVAKLPAASSRAGCTPGLAQVAFSCASEPENLAVLSDPTSPLTLEQIQKVGVGEAHGKRRLFEQQLRESQDSHSKELLMKWIISEDPADGETFNGGFGALVKWRCEQTHTEQPPG
jgi:hypothetical protein